MSEEQYLTEKHYLTCSNGATPKKIKVDSQKSTLMSGFKAATVEDKQKENNFICLGPVAFAAGAVAGVVAAACACVPGPGWIVAAVIAAAIIVAAAIGYMKCKNAIPTRSWMNPAPALSIENKKALLLSSFIDCKGQGGVITPRATLWEAWGHQTLTNLGHIANFAFGFLVGRGMGAVGAEGYAAYTGATATGATTSTALGMGLRTAGRSFLNTAKKELIEQFTFKGFSKAPFWCKVLRGAGIGGAYYDQYKIWSSDKDVVDKLKESGISLVLGVFAAKGASVSCFPEGTKIHTPNGPRNIEDLQVGDLVLTYNEETLEQEYKPILVKHERYTMQMMALELPTGEFLQVTPEHRFYHNGEWIEAGSLKPGDLLHLKNGDYTTIMGMETLPRYQKVYNFDVEGNENYYVTEDGILVHNGYGGKPTKPDPNDLDPDNINAINRENESAQTLSKDFDVEQNPVGDFGGKNPDYKINGEVYDCYAPNSDSARNIAKNAQDSKINAGQTKNIVFNLDDSKVTLDQMRKQLNDWPIDGMDNAIGIKNGEVVKLYP